MITCQNCSEPVTEQFARVFGDEDNTVWACLDCETGRALHAGAAAQSSAPTYAGIALPNS